MGNHFPDYENFQDLGNASCPEPGQKVETPKMFANKNK